MIWSAGIISDFFAGECKIRERTNFFDQELRFSGFFLLWAIIFIELRRSTWQRHCDTVPFAAAPNQRWTN
jgi:hypothetical protein